MELTLKNIFDWLLKHLALIIVISIIFASLAFVYSEFFIAPVFVSDIKLYVDSSDENEKDFTNILYYEKAAVQYIQFLSVDSFYKLVSEDLSQRGYNVAPEQLGAMMRFNTIEETSMFTVTVSSTDRKVSYEVARSICSVVSDYITSIKQNDTVRVIQYPVMATGPSYPSVHLFTIAGFIFGFALSSAIVVLKEHFDGRIKDVSDITEVYELPLLGIVPNITKNNTGRKGKRQ